ncbi:carboxypeptidase B-like [Pseudomyrmex gracilis]|uniref:carboxypeptidase B-like n=1 Tax=Pseudomyrmex gracilis TaxID=219809 RepID=UPI000994B252|nr:carboxypeptidase B-like [Pseudomyrmex gracilis]
MSAGVGSILCVILGMSGILAPHSANGSPYRDSYTLTHARFDHNYFEQRTLREENVLDNKSNSLQDIHNDQRTCLNSKDEKTERIELVDVNNSLQEASREVHWDYDNNRGFSMFGLVESLLSVIASGLGTVVNNILGSEKKNSRAQTNRINYRNYQLIRVFPNTESHVVDLHDLRDAEPEDVKFWSFPNLNRTTDIIVSPDLVADVKDYLRDKKIDFKVLISDVQKTISFQNPKMSKEQRDDLVTNQGHTMTWKRYHRYGDIVRYLEYLASRYPKIVELTTIGHSYEGQPIKMAKVSTGLKKDGERKPAIWIDAGMHGREWIGIAVATYILSQLVERNSTYSKLLDNSDWMILPVANPDGYEYTHIGDRLWRKTRSNHVESQEDSRYTPSNLLQFVAHYTRWLWSNCEGVDPNRNFAYHWGEEKERSSSSDPCHENYSGPFAFSEPETKAIADHILANKQHIRMYLTLHSYSQMWLLPWSHTRSKPADYSDLMNVAKKAINAITKVHGTHYQIGPTTDLMYPTSGSSDDWAKGVAGIKYAYTIELRDRGTYGFLLPATQIVPTAREIWAGIRAVARVVTCNM